MNWRWGLFAIGFSFTLLVGGDLREDGQFEWLYFIVAFVLIDIPLLLLALQWI